MIKLLKLKLLAILFLVLFNCTNNKLKINENKNVSSKEITKEIEDQNELNKKVSSNEYVYLFYNRNYFIKKDTKKNVDKNIKEIKGEDYRVIIEWQVEGERFVRLKDLKSGKEIVVKEGDTSGNIILIKRTLDFYTFKIDNTIIKVKR